MGVCVSAGGLGVYSTRWPQAGHSSPAPPWRTSSTSSSGYWVSEGPPEVPFYHAGTSCVPPCDRRHAHGGELAGNLLHRRVQILQLPQIQTTAHHQPRSQVLGSRVCECTHARARVCVHMSDRKSSGTLTQAATRFLPRSNACTFPPARR